MRITETKSRAVHTIAYFSKKCLTKFLIADIIGLHGKHGKPIANKGFLWFAICENKKEDFDMREAPLAIRTSEEIKAKFDELAKLGDFENKGEFLSRLLIQYELEGKKNQVSVMKPAIEAVEELSARLLEIINGTAAELLTREEKQVKDIEDMKAQMQEKITELESVCAADGERIALLETKLEESQGEVARLENVLKDKEALLKSHKDSSEIQSKLNEVLAAIGKQAKPKTTRTTQKQ